MDIKTIKLLLVEDDTNIGYLLKKYLEIHDFKVEWAKNSSEALKLLESQKFHLCILDINLPDVNGFDLSIQIKKKTTNQPIIFLTARNIKVDKLYGFKLGADDYITKPVDEEELVARIRAVLNRSYPKSTEKNNGLIQLGQYEFSPENLQLKLADEVIQLTQKEMELLLLLYQNKEQLLTRKEALHTIWGAYDYFKRKSMDVYISKLRKYLANDPAIKIINIHGQGFILSIKNS
ncbi:MAG: response regulator transcription factor [Bacteroidota bacterium]